MATTQEAIARLRMIFETQGADVAVAEMKKLEAAETSLGTTSLNLDRSFANLERRYSETARATADYERAMRTLNAAVAQNPALAERAAAVQQTIAARYQTTMQAARQAQTTQTALGVGMQAVAAQAQSASAATGILGAALQTLGSRGTAAAVTIGVVYLAYKTLSEGVERTVQYARHIREFSEATGLSASQVQALNKEASRFGIDTDKMQMGLQRFVAQMDEFREGGGELLNVVRGIDSGLAEQLQQTSDTAKQLELFQKVLENTTTSAQKLRAERTAFGRGGTALGQMDFTGAMQRFAGKGLAQETIDEVARLQGEIDARGTAIANKIYGSMAVPWKQAELSLISYFEMFLNYSMRMGQVLAVKLGRGGVSDQAQLAPRTTSKEDESENVKRLISEYKNLQSVLGSLMPVEQQVAAAALEMQVALENAPQRFKEQIKEAIPALLALKRVQAEMSQVAPGTDERRLAVIQQMKAQYPGLVAQDAIRMSLLNDQLRVAQAITGAQRIQAEEQARINQLKAEGKDLETAMLIAAQERANAEAAVNANVERQVISLNESTQLIKAQILDMQEQAGSAQKILGIHEMNVRAQQAFNQAIHEGASAEEAAALKAATYNNLLAQRTMQIEQQKQSARRADLQFAAGYSYEEDDRGSGSQFAQSQQALGEQFKSLAQAGSQTAQTMLAQLEGAYGAAWLFNADRLMGPLRKAQEEVADLPKQQRAGQALDELKQLQEQFRLGGAATDQEKAQIQWQLTYEKLIKEGVSASVAQQIANQELANTMQQLAKSVDANTTALQSQLDPIYTEGRTALRIGYYGEGSGGTQRVVTGTGYANENVPAGGNAQASNLIVINNNFAAGAVMGDRRTQYQAANAYGRAIAATGK
jgi:hypothetical protein